MPGAGAVHHIKPATRAPWTCGPEPISTGTLTCRVLSGRPNPARPTLRHSGRESLHRASFTALGSVFVHVVHVGDVWVLMTLALVSVPVRMGLTGWIIRAVRVLMMVVMHMTVLVLHR